MAFQFRPVFYGYQTPFFLIRNMLLLMCVIFQAYQSIGYFHTEYSISLFQSNTMPDYSIKIDIPGTAHVLLSLFLHYFAVTAFSLGQYQLVF